MTKERLKKTMSNRKEKILGSMVLSVQGISFSHSGQAELLDDITFSLHKKERVALVGPNGVGKTTLLEIIRRKITPDNGQVVISRNIRIGFLPQTIVEAELPKSGCVGDFIKSGRGLDKLEKEMEDIERKLSEKTENSQAIKKYGNLQERYELLGGYGADQEALRLLAGLELVDAGLDIQIKTLSGGQKTRLFLARVLFSQPELLLLDEPTNHLDKSVLEWLSGYLGNFKGALLVVSHDQRFLDATVDRVLRLNEFTGRIETYPGNYTNFLRLKEERDLSLKRQRRNQEKELQKFRQAISLWRRRGKRAKEAKIMERRVGKLKESLIKAPQHSKRSKFFFEVGERSYEDVLRVDSLSKSFGKKAVLRRASFNLFRGECIAILGPNGSGKSTLLKIIVGELTPDAGKVDLGKKVTIGYYAQEHEVLNFDSTVLEEARNMRPNLPETRLRAALGRFLFSGGDVHKKISMLSPGERTKLALAKIMLGRFNTLILDEPVNHLDMESRERLMKILAEFLENDGTIIVTSHDTELIDALNPDRILIMPGEKLEQRSVTI
jgi:ATP-binding cassette subfamily F protein 3